MLCGEDVRVMAWCQTLRHCQFQPHQSLPQVQCFKNKVSIQSLNQFMFYYVLTVNNIENRKEAVRIVACVAEYEKW